MAILAVLLAASPSAATLTSRVLATSPRANWPAGARPGRGIATGSPPVQVLVPGDVASIVASDTAINNRANASLSIPLQDSHETCLQQVLDDADLPR